MIKTIKIFHRKTSQKRNNLQKFMLKKKLMSQNRKNQQETKMIKKNQSRKEKVKELLSKKELSKTNWITNKRSKMLQWTI